MGRRIEFERLRTDDELSALEPAWRELFERSGTANPFVHPAWLMTWLRQFVPEPDRRRVLALRRSGELIAVAPFYLRRVGGGRTLQLAGAPAQEDPLTELSEVLALPGARRQVLRALVEELVGEHASGCDWFGLTLPPEHGWFDDDWIPWDWRRRGAFSMHKSARAFPIVALAESWEAMPLKPNIRNAVRRSENRHARLGSSVELRFEDGPRARAAAGEVQDLHRQRANGHRGPAHHDYFADPRVAELAAVGTSALAEAGHAYVTVCEIDGAPAAGRVVLRAGGQSFLSYSGLDPAHWQLGSPTLLLTEIIRRSIADGDRALNLSLNPDSAKQRWTQRIELHNEFVVVAPSRRSRALFSLFWQARFARALRDRRRYASHPESAGGE
jgi:CelD/BcsL family acetyltransferase involved in cellulose biosynthesis